jgi:uncharacterized membrane protein HdeD (DUF308 family)
MDRDAVQLLRPIERENPMNAQESSLRLVSTRTKVMGVLTIAFGILAIAMPWAAGQSFMWLVGALVTAGGLTRMVWAFQAGPGQRHYRT